MPDAQRVRLLQPTSGLVPPNILDRWRGAYYSPKRVEAHLRMTARMQWPTGCGIESKTLYLLNRQDNEIAFTSQIGRIN